MKKYIERLKLIMTTRISLNLYVWQWSLISVVLLIGGAFLG